ncbi:UNVERIFIED_CONTAM: hypothetical protein FKN15_012534 [Acipenser sinensis]
MEEQKGQSSRDSSEGESVSLSPNLPSPLILPHPAAQQAHRATNFFIDNILRPDFGCKKEPGNRDRAQTSGRENVNPLIVRPSNPSTLCQDSNCSSDSASSSSSSSSSSSPSSKQSQLNQDEGNGTNTTKYGENNNSTMIVSLNKGANAKKDAQPLLWPAWMTVNKVSCQHGSLVGVVGGNRCRKRNQLNRDRLFRVSLEILSGCKLDGLEPVHRVCSVKGSKAGTRKDGAPNAPEGSAELAEEAAPVNCKPPVQGPWLGRTCKGGVLTSRRVGAKHRCTECLSTMGACDSPQRALCVRGPLANNGKRNHREYQLSGKTSSRAVALADTPPCKQLVAMVSPIEGRPTALCNGVVLGTCNYAPLLIWSPSGFHLPSRWSIQEAAYHRPYTASFPIGREIYNIDPFSIIVPKHRCTKALSIQAPRHTGSGAQGRRSTEALRHRYRERLSTKGAKALRQQGSGAPRAPKHRGTRL